MTNLTISVRTIDGGNVEVEESSSRKQFGQSDVEFVAELLDRAAAKVRAAYGLPGSKDVGRCMELTPPFSDRRRVACILNHGHTGAHQAEDGADWWQNPTTQPTAPVSDVAASEEGSA